jgi:hypothetical protein
MSGRDGYESWKARVLNRAGLQTGYGDEVSTDLAQSNDRLGFFSGVWVQLQMYWVCTHLHTSSLFLVIHMLHG